MHPTEQAGFFTGAGWHQKEIRPENIQDLVEMNHRINMALEIGRMEWWEWDVQMDIFRMSAGKKEIFKLESIPDNEITSQMFTEKIHNEDLKNVKEAFEAHFLGQAAYYDAEYRITDREGKIRWLHDRGMISSRDADGKPLKMIGLAQDISHHKMVQAELLDAKERAEEADRLKTAFLTNMSHEIRTPMNAIIGFSELLADPNITKEDIGNYTHIIKNRSSHLLQIVNDILDISRIEANQIQLKEAPVLLNHLLDDIYLIYAQKLIDDKKFKIILSVEKSLDDASSVFRVDELRLRQIIGNLLDNAIKFTNVGSIEFGYRLVEGVFVFHVSDTGIGISEDKHELIFERFRQVDTSLARRFGGNGLGLAICKAFVEIMGGRIWVESKPGGGSAFYFSLAVKNKKTRSTAARSERMGLTGYNWQGKRILLVEDDVHSSVFMTELFRLTGVELVCSCTAMEAMHLFQENPLFDIVLMDIQLPDMSGIELTKLMKNVNPNVPVIAQTAYAMAGDNIKCMEAGCDDYISKPLNISDLFSKINTLICM